VKIISNIKENELLQMLQNGDKMAFDEIYRMFQPALVFFANRLLFAQTFQGAEEIVQDTLMKFYERRRNFTTLPQIKVFLYTVTKNACLQLIEKEKVKTKRYTKLMADFNEEEELILNEIIYSEALRQLKSEIEKLPRKCREVMEKLIFEDKSANETAVELDITVSTVNNHKAHAIAVLKKKLSGTGLLLLLNQL